MSSRFTGESLTAYLQEVSDQARQQFGKRPSENVAEKFWVDHYHFLIKRGYQIHYKFDPDWIPPWELDPSSHPLDFEESLPVGIFVMDAICIANGSRVGIKRVKTHKTELPILQYLSTPALRADPRNHCVPLLDAIPVPADDDIVLVVMPFLLGCDKLPFRRVGEIVELMLQLFESVELLHEHNIVHMDACRGNVMLDAEPLITTTWHSTQWTKQEGLKKPIEWIDRWSKRPNTYYLIDFDLSRWVPHKEWAKFRGQWGQDKTVPEMSLTVFCDGFKVDVYQMGNFINYFIKQYTDVDVLQAIADALTNKDPTQRPNARQAVRLMREFSNRVSKVELSRRIWKSNSNRPTPNAQERFLIKYLGYNPLY